MHGFDSFDQGHLMMPSSTDQAPDFDLFIESDLFSGTSASAPVGGEASSHLQASGLKASTSPLSLSRSSSTPQSSSSSIFPPSPHLSDVFSFHSAGPSSALHDFTFDFIENSQPSIDMHPSITPFGQDPSKDAAFEEAARKGFSPKVEQDASLMWTDSDAMAEDTSRAEAFESIGFDGPYAAAPSPAIANLDASSHAQVPQLPPPGTTVLGAQVAQAASSPTPPTFTAAEVQSPRSEKKRKLNSTSAADSVASSGGKKGPRGRKAGAREQSKEAKEGADNAQADGPASPRAVEDRGTIDPDSTPTTQSAAPKKAPGQRRPPPSASQITAAGNPFPVIDTSAKHSSLFVPPDTSGLTKREARLVKNRAAAFLSRQRKREQFDELEVKCKALSRMGWRMWEAIAGSDAPAEAINMTILKVLFADEEAGVRSCLEEIIRKKGASIAPTAEDAHSTNRDSAAPESVRSSSPTKQGSPSPAPEETGATPSKAKRGARAEVERLKAELSASKAREASLQREVESVRRTLRSTALCGEGERSWSATGFPGSIPPCELPQPPHVPSQHMQVPPNGLPTNGGGLSITIAPDPASLPAVGIKMERDDSLPVHFSSSADPVRTGDEMETSIDFARTPTIERFSAAAIRSKKQSKAFARGESLGLGLNLGAIRMASCSPTVQPPSSPSTASTTSDSTTVHFGGGGGGGQSVVHHHANEKRKAAGSMALMVILFSFALLGMPAAEFSRIGLSRTGSSSLGGFSLGRLLEPASSNSKFSLIGRNPDEDEDEDGSLVPTPSRPSSHLSANDLSLHAPEHLQALPASSLIEHESIRKMTEATVDETGVQPSADVADLLPMCSLEDNSQDPLEDTTGVVDVANQSWIASSMPFSIDLGGVGQGGKAFLLLESPTATKAKSASNSGGMEIDGEERGERGERGVMEEEEEEENVPTKLALFLPGSAGRAISSGPLHPATGVSQDSFGRESLSLKSFEQITAGVGPTEDQSEDFVRMDFKLDSTKRRQGRDQVMGLIGAAAAAFALATAAGKKVKVEKD